MKKVTGILVGSAGVVLVVALYAGFCVAVIFYGPYVAYWIKVLPEMRAQKPPDRPDASQIAGSYEANTTWGSAELNLKQDGTFDESFINTGTERAGVAGTWSVKMGDPATGPVASLEPFIAITETSCGPRLKRAEIVFVKGERGRIFATPQTGHNSYFHKK